MKPFVASLKTRVMRQQRKRRRRFEQQGKIEFAVAANADEAVAWLTEAVAIKREWLRATGRISRAFLRSETIACLIDLARKSSDPGSSPRMVVSRLSLDGQTAAIEMGLQEGRTYHLYLGAFAPGFAKFGPGNILTEKLLGWCVENDIERYDMMAPRSRNKSEWQSGEVAVLDFAVPTTIRGRLYIAIILRRLLPAIRRFFYALPDSVRSRLAGFALRNLHNADALAKR
jgi:CelD/BcsL family acetyltransferase involved in cellulose biosynthesis